MERRKRTQRRRRLRDAREHRDHRTHTTHTFSRSARRDAVCRPSGVRYTQPTRPPLSADPQQRRRLSFLFSFCSSQHILFYHYTSFYYFYTFLFPFWFFFSSHCYPRISFNCCFDTAQPNATYLNTRPSILSL